MDAPELCTKELIPIAGSLRMRVRRAGLIALPSLFIVAALGTACGQTPNQASEVIVSGLRYAAEAKLVDVAPTRLQAVVTLTNVTDKTIHVESGGCAFARLLAFDNPARSGAPKWDSVDRHDPVTGTRYACPHILYQWEVVPGESLSPKELQLLIPSYEIVGHPLVGRSLPDGPYYWLAQVQINNETIDVPAGQATLTMNEPPLPRERIAAGLVYQVSARTTTPPLGIEATLTVTNNNDERVGILIARDCPFSIFVYREEARRDAAYVAGEPDWASSEGCVLEMTAVRFAPGESRQFTVTLPVSEVLGDSLADGRYYLTASVHLRDESYQSLLLAAGDVELRR